MRQKTLCDVFPFAKAEMDKITWYLHWWEVHASWSEHYNYKEMTLRLPFLTNIEIYLL